MSEITTTEETYIPEWFTDPLLAEQIVTRLSQKPGFKNLVAGRNALMKADTAIELDRANQAMVCAGLGRLSEIYDEVHQLVCDIGEMLYGSPDNPGWLGADLACLDEAYPYPPTEPNPISIELTNKASIPPTATEES